MLVLIWLVVFALVAFSPVDTIPALTPDRILRSKSSSEEVEEQIVIAKLPGTTSPTSRFSNWYHDSCTFTGDVSTQNSATRNGDLSRSETVTLLPYKVEAMSDCIHVATKLCNPTSGTKSDKTSAPSVLKQHVSSVLGEAEATGRAHSLRLPKLNAWDAKTSDCPVSLSSDVASAEIIVQAATTPLPFGNLLHRAMHWPRSAFRGKVPSANGPLLHERLCHPVCENAEYSVCCEEGQFCATSNGIPYCGTSISSATPGFSSTSSTLTDVVPISSSQTTDLSSATTGPSSSAEKLSTTSSILTTIVTTITTPASLTQLSTSQSSSTASDTPTSTAGSSSSSSLPSPAPSSQGIGRGGLSTSDKIALGIGIGIGIPTLLIGIPAFIIAMRKL